MTYRRRHRWLRRLALGLAFATFAAPAAARPDASGDGPGVVKAGGWTGLVDTNTGIPLSAGIPQGEVGARPDNKADRFAHSDVASSRYEPASSGSSVDWDGALTLGIGAVVLAVALGIGLGFIRRPRLAGF